MRRLTPFCFAVSALALLAATQPAAARIQCNGNFQMTDSEGITVTAKERLVARVTLKDGRITYERPAD